MSSAQSRRALAQKLTSISRGWQRLADAELMQFGISNSAAWCLIYLDRLGADVRQTDLAEILQISQPSLVRTLHQLETAGLVGREADPDDRRSNHLNLTPEGQHLVGRIEEKLDTLRRDLLHAMPQNDIEATTRVLDLLSQRIADRRAGRV